MIVLLKFRANDLNPQKGKQIEFNKGIVDTFFHFSEHEHEAEFDCYELNNSNTKSHIKVHFTLSPSRGDYKIYQNLDGSEDLKDFFIETLHLTVENNIDDYFAIRKRSEYRYDLYYIPKHSIFSEFYSKMQHEVIQVIPESPKATIENKNCNLQTIFYGAPGTGKSFAIKQQTSKESVIRTTFHPDSDYSTFVGAYKPTTKEVVLRDLSGHKVEEDGKTLTESKIVYEFVNQAFLQAYIKAWEFYAEAEEETDVKKQFLVIEEINRGNCAQIFGDLFQLLDRNDYGFSDYPIQADADMKKQLQKAFTNLNIAFSDSINAMYTDRENTIQDVLNGDILLLPNNLYIWATMNTSDQSLFPIDSAFKRRWDWKYMPIYNANKEYKIQIGDNFYDWWIFLQKINALIGGTTSSEDKKLGYFFCKAKDKIISAETFVGKVIFYLWNDVFKDYEFANEVFDDIDGSKLTFDKFYTTDENGNSTIINNKVELFFNNLDLKAINTEVEEISE